MTNQPYNIAFTQDLGFSFLSSCTGELDTVTLQIDAQADLDLDLEVFVGFGFGEGSSEAWLTLTKEIAATIEGEVVFTFPQDLVVLESHTYSFRLATTNGINLSLAVGVMPSGSILSCLLLLGTDVSCWIAAPPTN